MRRDPSRPAATEGRLPGVHDNEIPIGARSRAYRLLEMLPGAVSLGIPLAAIVLSFIDLRAGAAFVIAFLFLGLARAFRGGVDSLRGYARLRSAERIDWAALCRWADDCADAGAAGRGAPRAPLSLEGVHVRRAAAFAARLAADPSAAPRTRELVHAVIVAAYDEPLDVIEPSIRSLLDTGHPAERIVVVFAHEERGGEPMRRTAGELRRRYGGRFRAFLAEEHPAGLPGEIPGKGANISWAGRRLLAWCAETGTDPERVLVTTLDCDNRVSRGYLDAVSYEFARAADRRRVSFQPISLFVNNIWHAPAPTRVIAAGNTLWNLISTVRPRALRNFASHTQPLGALMDMGFWSRRTIVEDGHQYWRSYFHFRGRYRVVPIHLAITQDAVLARTLRRTLLAQFRQLCRWAYGASDVPYVGVRLLGRGRSAPFWPTFGRFLQLLESHVTLAVLAPMLAFGVWLPVLVAQLVVPVGRIGFETHRFIELLPDLSTLTQRIALVGLLTAIPLTILLLPQRPGDVPARRWLGMLLQWALLPVTLFCYTATSAFSAQVRLLIGAYREQFAVTEKAAVLAGPREADPEPTAVDWSHGRRDGVRQDRFG